MKHFKTHPYQVHIPEIVSGWEIDDNVWIVIGDFLHENKIICSDEAVEHLESFLFEKLCNHYGGAHRVVSKDIKDEKAVNDSLKIFRSQLGILIRALPTYKIFSGLNTLLSGNTDFVKYPPTYSEFLDLCKNANTRALDRLDENKKEAAERKLLEGLPSEKKPLSPEEGRRRVTELMEKLAQNKLKQIKIEQEKNLTKIEEEKLLNEARENYKELLDEPS